MPGVLHMSERTPSRKKKKEKHFTIEGCGIFFFFWNKHECIPLMLTRDAQNKFIIP